jgi:hypothetical protein
VCRPSHIKPPDAVGDLIRDPPGLVGVRFQTLYPVVQSKTIVFPQALYVADFESGMFRDPQ